MDFFDGIDFCLGWTHPDYRITHSHVPTYYGVQYNHAGPLRLCLDRQTEHQMNGPCVFVSHPGAFFDYGPIGDQPRYHQYICFCGPRVQQYIRSGLLPLDQKKPLIAIRHPDKFQQTMLELIKAIHCDRFRHDRMVLMLEDLLLQLHEQDDLDKKLPSWLSPHFAKLLESISLDPHRQWDFTQEAMKINVTPVHFRRLFKQFCGLPPKQYLLQRRLRAAADRLINSSAQISEIAQQVGIDDIFYFSRVFKRQYAVSPLAYRKEFVGK